MEYRDFRYSNEHGQVDLKRGSYIGIAVSWLILKSLHIVLFLIVVGIGFSTWKYFMSNQVEAKLIDPMSPEGVYNSSAPMIDYSKHALPAGAVDTPSYSPVPAPSHRLASRMTHHTTHY